jgi:UDP-glucuronate 4-epimerase
MKILVTGTAGFIGFNLASRLIETGDEIVGLDNINDYYSVDLKLDRLAQTGINRDKISYNKMVKSEIYPNYRFIKLNLEDSENVARLFASEKFDRVVNLAAQAGVRYSLENPQVYIDSNITGFLNILEGCRYNQVEHLVYASSSSVYGLNETMPLSVEDNVDHPISLYATSKKCNELMAHTYSHLFGLPTTGLRFFSVYGPWGRPDMALFIFTKAIFEGQTIDVFNNGMMERDFTYVKDIVEGVYRIVYKVPEGNPKWSGKDPDPSTSRGPYRLFNIGNSTPVKLMDFINAIEEVTGIEVKKNMLPMQPGDVPRTWADVDHLIEHFDYKPETNVKDGVRNFVNWYKEYYKVKA